MINFIRTGAIFTGPSDCLKTVLEINFAD